MKKQVKRQLDKKNEKITKSYTEKSDMGTGTYTSGQKCDRD